MVSRGGGQRGYGQGPYFCAFYFPDRQRYRDCVTHNGNTSTKTNTKIMIMTMNMHGNMTMKRSLDHNYDHYLDLDVCIFLMFFVVCMFF